MESSMNTVCVLGLGYIGLPTASLVATKGYSVLGVDVNAETVATINQGRIHIHEPDLDILVKSAVQSGKLRAALKPEAADIFIIAVPTPFTAGNKPDLTYVEVATKSILPVLKAGDLVILESTSPVGTTERIREIVYAGRPDLSGGKLLFAHCPERVLPGQILKELILNDRIVGGVDSASSEKARDFYASFVTGQIFLTDSRTAEMAKLTENAYRDVNIAFANELSMISDRLGIDVWKLIELANRHPRVKILQPGPGVGGHCIAVDPWFIVDSAPEESRLIRTARIVNDSKPAHVVAKIRAALRESGTRTVACLGLAFKANVDDLRSSPAIEIAEALAKEGVQVLAVEPHVKALPESLRAPNVQLVSAETAVQKADVVALLVDHNDFRKLSGSPLLTGKKLIDTRGIWK